jgi:hypothetical protein
MYQFSTQEIAGLQVAQTVAKSGTNHKKAYAAAGVTPATQDTLNVYVSGQFRFDCGQFSQTLVAGQTSHDLTLAAYPAGEICEETVLSAWGMRFCVSSKKPWERERFTLNAGQTLELTKDSLLVLVSGSVDVSGSAMAPVGYRFAPRGCIVTPVNAPAQVIVCRLQ